LENRSFKNKMKWVVGLQGREGVDINTHTDTLFLFRDGFSRSI
jgi:hypothetical protein